MMMTRFLSGTRYLILIPILGLAIAASFFFVFGGLGLIIALAEVLLAGLSGAAEAHTASLPVEVEIVEYVHRFLIGTVLYITAVGLYQLFVQEIQFPRWLRIDSTEELETNLIGVTVVVLAVNFMGVVFTRNAQDLLEYGAGIALPIAALALFVGLRTWSTNLTKKTALEVEGHQVDEEKERES
jgi:uncharacterized membrane protein YqhA